LGAVDPKLWSKSAKPHGRRLTLSNFLVVSNQPALVLPFGLALWTPCWWYIRLLQPFLRRINMLADTQRPDMQTPQLTDHPFDFQSYYIDQTTTNPKSR
jgi:hypothetical protein